MALSKEQEDWLDKVSTVENKDEIHWRYGRPSVYNVFGDMPKELVTEEFTLATVQKNGYLLFFAPEELKTKAVCRAAVENTGLCLLGGVPEKLITEELCLIAMQKGSLELWRVPEKIKTEAVCIAAVKQDPQMLQHVPKKLLSKVNAALKE